MAYQDDVDEGSRWYVLVVDESCPLDGKKIYASSRADNVNFKEGNLVEFELEDMGNEVFRAKFLRKNDYSREPGW